MAQLKTPPAHSEPTTRSTIRRLDIALDLLIDFLLDTPDPLHKGASENKQP